MPHAVQNTSYLFIDGDNLRWTLKAIADRAFDGDNLPLDWTRLCAPHRK